MMPKNLEETVMFTNEDEGFQELFDGLLAYSSTKQSVKMNESKRQTRRDDPMDVDALSKGKSKGKGKKDPGDYASDSGDKGSGKSKGGKGKVDKGKVKGKGKGKLNSAEKQQLARRMVGSRNVTSRTG